MDQIILLSKEQLQELVENAVRKVLGEQKRDAPSEGEGPLTIIEAAAYLNLSVATLYRYTSQRRIPHHKPGKQLYFLKEELDQWLSEHKKVTVNEIAASDFTLKETKSGKAADCRKG